MLAVTLCVFLGLGVGFVQSATLAALTPEGNIQGRITAGGVLTAMGFGPIVKLTGMKDHGMEEQYDFSKLTNADESKGSANTDDRVYVMDGETGKVMSLEGRGIFDKIKEEFQKAKGGFEKAKGVLEKAKEVYTDLAPVLKPVLAAALADEPKTLSANPDQHVYILDAETGEVMAVQERGWFGDLAKNALQGAINGALSG